MGCCRIPCHAEKKEKQKWGVIAHALMLKLQKKKLQHVCIKALHERSPPVMHRDLHSDNILIGEDRAVLADLGSAKEVIHGERYVHNNYAHVCVCMCTLVCAFTGVCAPPHPRPHLSLLFQ